MRKIYITVLLIYIASLLVALTIPGRLTWISYGIAIVMTAYYLIRAMKGSAVKRAAGTRPSGLFVFLLTVPIALGAITFYEGITGFKSLLYAILASGLTFITWNYMFMIPLAVYHKYKEIEEMKRPLYYKPLVSVIVPAHNEEKVIAATIESILESDYPRKEVIVVDDGSTDRTFDTALKYRGRGVKVLRKETGGKGKVPALNFGIRFSKGEIIVVVDADTIIGRRTITELVRKFQDPEVSAASGNVMVRNHVNLITKLQALEYIIAFNLARRALDIYGAVTIISGALGAFRRHILESVGLYDKDTLVEDFDVTIKALKTGKIVQASSSAVGFTEAPETLRDLYRQRLRWYRGAFEVMLKHRDAFVNPRYGYLQRLGLPFIVMQMIVIPLVDAATFVSITLALWFGLIIPILMQFLAFSLLQLLIFLLTLQIAEEKDISLAFLPLFVIGYKYLHEIWMIKALLDVIFARLTKRKYEWTFIERTGIEDLRKISLILDVHDVVEPCDITRSLLGTPLYYPHL